MDSKIYLKFYLNYFRIQMVHLQQLAKTEGQQDNTQIITQNSWITGDLAYYVIMLEK